MLQWGQNELKLVQILQNLRVSASKWGTEGSKIFRGLRRQNSLRNQRAISDYSVSNEIIHLYPSEKKSQNSHRNRQKPPKPPSGAIYKTLLVFQNCRESNSVWKIGIRLENSSIWSKSIAVAIKAMQKKFSFFTVLINALVISHCEKN